MVRLDMKWKVKVCLRYCWSCKHWLHQITNTVGSISNLFVQILPRHLSNVKQEIWPLYHNDQFVENFHFCFVT